MLIASFALLFAAAPVKLGCPGFVCDGLSAALCEAYVDRFAAVLGSGGQVKVTTQRDMLEMLANERQKQLLGCSDDSASCLAELAGALGADGVLSARIAATGSGFLVTAKVSRAADGSGWVTYTERVATEPEVQTALDAAAQRFRAELTGGERSPLSATRLALWGLTAAGAAMAVTGGVLFGLSKGWAATLKSDAPQTPAEVMATARMGGTAQGLGLALMLVGTPLAVATSIALAKGVGAPLGVAVWVSDRAAGLAWGGAWP